MPAYGSEQWQVTKSPLRRAFVRVAGSYDLGARTRFALLEPRLAQLEEPARILDAGSGKGELCFAMARRWPAAEIVGVDADAELVGKAQQLRSLVAPQANIVFENKALPQQFTSRFDLVISVDVLEHIEDDVAFLQGLFNATAENGLLILHTPATAQRRFLAEFEEQHDHVRDGYEREVLDAKLNCVGYRDVTIQPTFGALASIAWEGFTLARGGNAFAAAALPVWYALAKFDTRRVPARGNGLLATARRQ